MDLLGIPFAFMPVYLVDYLSFLIMYEIRSNNKINKRPNISLYGDFVRLKGYCLIVNVTAQNQVNPFHLNYVMEETKNHPVIWVNRPFN